MYNDKVPIPPLAMVDDIASMALCDSVTAVSCNTKTDTFIESKKLEGQVGEGKCQWVHIGPGECKSSYIINESKISQAEKYKYLGDFVSNLWKNLYDKRWEKAQGYAATCQAMCIEISLGHQLYAMAKLFHRSIFTNGTLVNMETWPNCSVERIESFERIEQTFFRKMLNAHSKTPIEAIYLELGVIPLRFQLMKRRILYLREIMDRSDDELTKQVVLAQQEDCGHGDFYAQVKRDMNEFSISNEEIGFSEEKLREILKTKAENCAFAYLIKKAQTHTKVQDQIYKNCDGMAHYFDPRFTADLSNLIFKFRTRTYLVKNNFRNNYRNTNIQCPLCDLHEDTQAHLFECEKVVAGLSENISSKPVDVYSNNIDTLYSVACTLKKLVDIRENLLDSEKST